MAVFRTRRKLYSYPVIKFRNDHPSIKTSKYNVSQNDYVKDIVSKSLSGTEYEGNESIINQITDSVYPAFKSAEEKGDKISNMKLSITPDGKVNTKFEYK